MNQQFPLLCAESAGVPMLLCPAEFVSYWEGINEPSNGRVVEAGFLLNTPDGPHVDYDRACDLADEYVNTIQIGPGQALLFGDEIPALYWIATEQFVGGYVLTWLYLPKEKPDYYALVRSLPADCFHETGCTATCSAEGFILFPSTQAPIDGEYFEFIQVRLPAGTYAASLGFYETPDTSLRIIKIERQN